MNIAVSVALDAVTMTTGGTFILAVHTSMKSLTTTMAIALFSLRVYAMYGQSRTLLAVLSPFILERLAVAIWACVPSQ